VPGASARPRNTLADEILDQAPSARAALDRLLPMAGSGDTRAMLAVDRILLRCFAYGRPDSSTRTPTAQPGSPTYAQQLDLLADLQSYCDDPRALHPGDADTHDRNRERLRAAAKRGDPSALSLFVAEHLQMQTESRQLDRKGQLDLLFGLMRAPESPELVAAAINMLPRVDSGIGMNAIGLNRFAAGERVDAIRSYAAHWVACELGAHCGPNQSYDMQIKCLGEQNCAMDLSLPEFIRTRALSGGDYEAMLRYIAFLREQMGKSR
jgi:hypothetical protein